MVSRKRETGEKPKHRIRFGREEINLLEWGIFSAGTKVDRRTKSVTFEEPDWDPRSKKQLSRRLTVAFSTEHGRPTASDDEVMLALMTISWQRGFEAPKVDFTRYQVCQILSWPDTGENYRRIDRAFSRIRGVHLDFEKSFYDKATGSWVDRKFSLIDDAELYDRERYEKLRQLTDEGRPKSWFRWSEPLFQSMKAGCVKKVDLELLRGLDDSFAKRLFRWLDKNFYRKGRVQIPLDELAYDKLGMTGRYTASRIKQLLRPAFRELEERGIIMPGGDAERFRPSLGSRGEVHVVLDRAKWPRSCSGAGTSPRSTDEELLTTHGVGEKAAKELSRIAAGQKTGVKTRIEVVDWLEKKSDKRISRSKTGYLVSSIRENYELPEGFTPEEGQRCTAEKKPDTGAQVRQAAEGEARAARRGLESKSAPFWAFWQTLSPEEKLEFERAAVKAAPVMHREAYMRQARRITGLLRDGLVQIPCEKPRGSTELSLFDAIRVEVLLRHFEKTRAKESGLKASAVRGQK
jgi:hypothetical protein